MDRQTDRHKALDMAMGQIDKQFGKGSVMRMGERPNMDIEAISTGALSLDLALGIGGLPKGRVVEIFGPESSGKSTLAMHVVAEAQRMGGICAYIDAEHAVDPVYARPDRGRCRRAAHLPARHRGAGARDHRHADPFGGDRRHRHRLGRRPHAPRRRSRARWATPTSGLQARLMSQALRKLTGNLNQVQHHLHLHQPAPGKNRGHVRLFFAMAPGWLSPTARTEKIGKIVNQKLPVEVLSYDPELGSVVPKKVVNWFDNGQTDEFLHLHRGQAWRQRPSAVRLHAQPPDPHARRLARGRRAHGRRPRAPGRAASPLRLPVGGHPRGLMGDGALSPTRSGHGARFRFGHGAEQAPYAAWKASLFANVERSRSTNAKDARLLRLRAAARAGRVAAGRVHRREEGVQLRLPQAADASVPRPLVHGRRQLRHPRQGRSGADQGRQRPGRDLRPGDGADDAATGCVELPGRHVGSAPDARCAERGRRPCLVFPKDETAKLHALIAPFVHPSMDYKLLPRFRGQFAVEPVFVPMRNELVPLPIIDIDVQAADPERCTGSTSRSRARTTTSSMGSWCTTRPRPPRVGGRSSSTPRSAWTSAGSNPSRTASRSSVTAPG